MLKLKLDLETLSKVGSIHVSSTMFPWLKCCGLIEEKRKSSKLAKSGRCFHSPKWAVAPLKISRQVHELVGTLLTDGNRGPSCACC